MHATEIKVLLTDENAFKEKNGMDYHQYFIDILKTVIFSMNT